MKNRSFHCGKKAITTIWQKKLSSVVQTLLNNSYTIFPLGDSAATIDLGNAISEQLNDKIIAMQQWMLVNSFPGQKDIIVAYSSLTIIYDPVLIKKHFRPQDTIFEWVKTKLETAFHQVTNQPGNQSTKQPPNQSAVIRIPVCYDPELGVDINAMAAQRQLSNEQIIDLHTNRVYRVYTIGFLPGFSYMAEVDERLITPRKPRPEQVAAGSVGIAGAQTGIYPLNSPGGWHIIGRTPVKQFDAKSKELVKLKVGDRVQFYSISRSEFENRVNVEMW